MKNLRLGENRAGRTGVEEKMTEKQLKRLSRAELLELLILQTKESERLRGEAEELKQQLAERQIRIAEAGNLAAAVVEINGVMEAAQAAAQQYLDNAARMEEEAKQRSWKIIRTAQAEAQKIRQAAAEGTEYRPDSDGAETAGDDHEN